jgi:DNA-binding SARP family transcriptional activator
MMRCYLTLDEPAQAPLAYRRCCDILAVVFGLKPARETEAIRQKISG